MSFRRAASAAPCGRPAIRREYDLPPGGGIDQWPRDNALGCGTVLAGERDAEPGGHHLLQRPLSGTTVTHPELDGLSALAGTDPAGGSSET